MSQVVYTMGKVELYGRKVEMVTMKASGAPDDAISAKADGSIPENYALIAQVIGLRISLNPESAMTLGERAEAALKKAVDVGPNNPRVELIRGINALYTPTEFGGGTVKARAFLSRAIELFPADRPPAPLPTWGLGEAYGWLGVLNVREKNFDAARVAYAHALEVEPNYAWIKDRLSPGLDRLIAAKAKAAESQKTP